MHQHAIVVAAGATPWMCTLDIVRSALGLTAESENEWYFAYGEGDADEQTRIGPLNLQEAQARAAGDSSGTAWCKGMTEWLPIAQIEALSGGGRAAVSPMGLVRSMRMVDVKHGAIALFFGVLSLAVFMVVVSLISSPSVATLPDDAVMEPARCNMWSSGVLTCNIHNAADEPSNVAVLVTVMCKGKNIDSSIYRETIIAESVPERGWSSVVVNSDGYTLFYKGIENRLTSHRDEMIRVATAGGLALTDLSGAQRVQMERTVFDVCTLASGEPSLTLTDRHRNVDFLAALKTFWGA